MNTILDGRVAIVTGAGRGIGRAHALELAAQGAAVVVNDFGVSLAGEGSGDSPADAVVAEIEAAGGRAVANGADVADFEQAAAMVQQAIDTFGGLDILVNNAGFVRDRMLVNTSEEEWDAVMRVHLKGHFAPLRHAGAYWRAESKAGRQRAARVINTSSGAGLQGSIGQTTYSAAKAGIAGMTLVAAAEMGRYGVTVNAIAPVARTRMTEGAFPDDDGRHRRRVRRHGPRQQLARRRLARLGGRRRRHRAGHRDRGRPDLRRAGLDPRPRSRPRPPLGDRRGRRSPARPARPGPGPRAGLRHQLTTAWRCWTRPAPTAMLRRMRLAAAVVLLLVVSLAATPATAAGPPTAPPSRTLVTAQQYWNLDGRCRGESDPEVYVPACKKRDRALKSLGLHQAKKFHRAWKHGKRKVVRRIVQDDLYLGYFRGRATGKPECSYDKSTPESSAG